MKLILSLILIISSLQAFSQLGFTEKQIVEKQGKYFKKEIGKTDIMLYYHSKIINDFGEPCTELIVYFVDIETKKCYLESYTSCKNAINSYVKTLNKMGVQLNDSIWKNYKNNSTYILKTEQNIASIGHSYSDVNLKTDLGLSVLKDELNICKRDYQTLLKQNEVLKDQNIKLINDSKKMITLTSSGAENIEKALQSMKEKDLKINRMQDALNKKDSIILIYINELKIKTGK